MHRKGQLPLLHNPNFPRRMTKKSPASRNRPLSSLEQTLGGGGWSEIDSDDTPQSRARPDVAHVRFRYRSMDVLLQTFAVHFRAEFDVE